MALLTVSEVMANPNTSTTIFQHSFAFYQSKRGQHCHFPFQVNVKQVKFKIHLLPSKKEKEKVEGDGEGTEDTEGAKEISPTQEIEDKGGCMIYGLVIEGCNQTVLPTSST